MDRQDCKVKAFWGLMAFLSLLALLANVGWRFYKDGQERAAIGFTTDLQVLSQQISKFATEAAAGNLEAFEELKTTRSNIESRVNGLLKGDAVAGIPGYQNDSDAVRIPLNKLNEDWQPINNAANTILSRQELVLDIIRDLATRFGDRPSLPEELAELFPKSKRKSLLV